MANRVEIEPAGDDDYEVRLGVDEPLSLKEHLGFTADIDQDVDRHPGWQAFWEITASFLAQEADEFALVEYRKFMAHCREFARLVARGRGQPATIEAINDLAVLIFGEDAQPVERRNFARAAYVQYLNETAGSQGAKKIVAAQDFETRLTAFESRMYRYLDQSPPATYEWVGRRRLELRGHAERVKAVAFAQGARGHMLTNRTKLEMPKVGNTQLGEAERAGRALYDDRVRPTNRRP